MCIFYKRLVLIFFFLFYFSNLNAQEKIVYVDVDYIYSNSIIGLDIKKKLLNDKKKINDELKVFQNKINSQIKDLETKKNLLSEDDYSLKRINIDKSVKNFNSNIKQKREKVLINPLVLIEIDIPLIFSLRLYKKFPSAFLEI